MILPLILPGVARAPCSPSSTSFDEVVVVLFMAGPEQRTLPRADVQRHPREHQPDHHRGGGDPDDGVSILLATMEGLRRRNERLKGNSA